MLLVQPAISAANQLQHDFVFTRSFDRCCPTILLLFSSPACRCLISYGGAAPSNSAVVISTNGRKFPFARDKHDLIKPPLPQLFIIPNEKKEKEKKFEYLTTSTPTLKAQLLQSKNDALQRIKRERS